MLKILRTVLLILSRSGVIGLLGSLFYFLLTFLFIPLESFFTQNEMSLDVIVFPLSLLCMLIGLLWYYPRVKGVASNMYVFMAIALLAGLIVRFLPPLISWSLIGNTS